MRSFLVLLISALLATTSHANTMVHIVPIGLSAKEIKDVFKGVKSDNDTYKSGVKINHLMSDDPVTTLLVRELRSTTQKIEIIIDIEGRPPLWANEIIRGKPVKGLSIKKGLERHFGYNVTVYLEEGPWYGISGEEAERQRRLNGGTTLVHVGITPNAGGDVSVNAKVWRTASRPPTSIVRSGLTGDGLDWKFNTCKDVSFQTVDDKGDSNLIACVHHERSRHQPGQAGLVLYSRSSPNRPTHFKRVMSLSDIAATIKEHAEQIGYGTRAVQVSRKPQRSTTQEKATRQKATKTTESVDSDWFAGVQIGLPLLIPGAGLELGKQRESALSAIGVRAEFNASNTTIDGTIGGIPIVLFTQLGTKKWDAPIAFEGMIGLRYGGPYQGTKPQMGLGIRLPQLGEWLGQTAVRGEGPLVLFARTHWFPYSQVVVSGDEVFVLGTGTASAVQIGISWRWGL